jgi:hypothetical protein
MSYQTHTVAPEDVMALLDGELSAAEAAVVSAHLEQCAECGRLAAELRSTSQSLAQWAVPAAPPALDNSVLESARKAAGKHKAARPIRTVSLSFWNWRLWAIGGGGAALAALLFAAVVASSIFRGDRPTAQRLGVMVYPQVEQKEAFAVSSKLRERTASEPVAPPPSAGIVGIAGMEQDSLQSASSAAVGKARVVAQSTEEKSSSAAGAAPMIARGVSLSILVKDLAAARPVVDAILARHLGYAAQLTISDDGSPRNLQASLRVPAPELPAALADLKTLGRVTRETQSGEEVSQQHADLVARLQNSRETEQRLRAILEQRTGRIDDVLQVEEEIARVRGEIEGMEAEQKALEHRVDFARVDLQLSEEDKARTKVPTASLSTRLERSFDAGIDHATDSLLGIVFLVEEFGPVLLIWLAILGLPAVLVWRRYRRVKARG